MVHRISATAIVGPGGLNDRIQLAMCGEQLGDYMDAVKAGHLVYTYTGVTCPACLARKDEA